MKTEGGTGGGGITGFQPETKPTEVNAADTKGSQGEGDKFDEFGYEKEPEKKGAPDTKGEGDKKPEPPPPTAKEPEATSGYGSEPPVVPPEPVVPPPEVKLDYEVDLKGLPDEETSKLKEFLKTHKMSKEQAQAISDNRKEFYAAQEKARTDFAATQAREEARIKADWHHELKTDPTFGGEKFNHNVKMVERVVEEFMPGTKKMLTERKSMLPPYVMRDLLKLGDQLFGSASLIQGQPPVPDEEKQQSDDEILRDMYK